MTNNITIAPKSRDLKISEMIYDYAEVLVFAICFVFIMFTFAVRVSVVNGESMENTLFDRDILLVSSIPYTPEVGDVVVFRAPYSAYYPDEHLVKRVIATAGQTVDIDFESWTVTVDGVVLDESDYIYIAGLAHKPDLTFPYTVPEGKVFLMGDNRNNSHDSRTTDIGAVDTDYIIGRAIMRVFPFNSIGSVE